MVATAATDPADPGHQSRIAAERTAMTRYRMEDNTVVDTANATLQWSEDTNLDGSNHISVATGSQWAHETLYRSRKGRYYIEHTSQRHGAMGYAEWISKRAAAAWLLANDNEVTPELAQAAEEVSE